MDLLLRNLFFALRRPAMTDVPEGDDCAPSNTPQQMQNLLGPGRQVQWGEAFPRPSRPQPLTSLRPLPPPSPGARAPSPLPSGFTTPFRRLSRQPTALGASVIIPPRPMCAGGRIHTLMYAYGRIHKFSAVVEAPISKSSCPLFE